jgi:protein-tyrosine phosphatase
MPIAWSRGNPEMIDIHSHIMPGIDDGARDLEEAVRMAEVAAADGIEQMISTPHMFNGLSHNPHPDEIAERVDQLQAAVGDLLKILPGNEVHISHEIAEQAKSNRVMKLNRRNYMLVEFPQLTVPIGAEDLFYKLQLQSICPILVHPERNAQIQSRPSIVSAFVERGVLVQVTAMSLTGEFGPAAKRCADLLVRHNCAHFIATDCHRPDRRPPILSRGRDAAAQLIGEQRARRLVYDNPLAVVNGGFVEADSPIPLGKTPPPSKPSFLSRFFGR